MTQDEVQTFILLMEARGAPTTLLPSENAMLVTQRPWGTHFYTKTGRPLLEALQRAERRLEKQK